MDLSQLKIAFIGAGNMGSALLRGLIDSDAVPAKHILVHDPSTERLEALAKAYGVNTAPSNRAVPEGQDVVVLAVKPQIIDPVLAEIKDTLGNALIISVAAGVSTGQIERQLGRGARVVRSMPNTPATIKAGATALAAGAHATQFDLQTAQEIFGKVGRAVIVDETHINAVTGLSGSGPAYVFLFVEALIDAGTNVGLPREVATSLALQSLSGSAQLLQETKTAPQELRAQVTSPGGTTVAGLQALEDGGFRKTITNAVEAATRRAKELGDG